MIVWGMVLDEPSRSDPDGHRIRNEGGAYPPPTNKFLLTSAAPSEFLLRAYPSRGIAWPRPCLVLAPNGSTGISS